jgi:hypothetical protein
VGHFPPTITGDDLRRHESGTAPVTTASAADFDVHGWSAGLLVHFGFRRGTLRLWSQRRCSAGRAAGYLAGTPTAWSAFAQRNADLAAALSPATAAPVLSS